jgi:hypothetical protein
MFKEEQQQENIFYHNDGALISPLSFSPGHEVQHLSAL